MIAREWKCRLPVEKYDEFIPYLHSTGVEDSMKVNGYMGYEIRKRCFMGKVEVTLITYWNDMDSIKGFAGDDLWTARLYPEDMKYDLDSDGFVLHYEVVDGRMN